MGANVLRSFWGPGVLQGIGRINYWMKLNSIIERPFLGEFITMTLIPILEKDLNMNG